MVVNVASDATDEFDLIAPARRPRKRKPLTARQKAEKWFAKHGHERYDGGLIFAAHMAGQRAARSKV